MGIAALFGFGDGSAAAVSETAMAVARKQLALDTATAIATREGRQPTLTDYYNAAQQQEQSHSVMSMAAYADLSGMRVDNFLIRHEDMRAVEAAQAGQGVNVNWRFDDTKFYNVTFRPATSYDPERSRGAVFDNVTFDGMEAGNQPVNLTDATYNGVVRFTNIRGGIINIGERVVIGSIDPEHPNEPRGLDIRGANAELHIGQGATVNNLDASGARIIDMSAGNGATINNPNFASATISMTSALQGSVWRGSSDASKFAFDNSNLTSVDFRGATLIDIRARNTAMAGVNFAGATISNLTIDDRENPAQDLAGMNLAGAHITNLIINGQLIRTPAQLQRLGIGFDGSTRIGVTDDASRADLKRLAANVNLRELSNYDPSAPPLAMPVMQQARARQQAQALDTTDTLLTEAKIDTTGNQHRIWAGTSHANLLNGAPPVEPPQAAPTPSRNPLAAFASMVTGGDHVDGHHEGIVTTANPDPVARRAEQTAAWNESAQALARMLSSNGRA